VCALLRHFNHVNCLSEREGEKGQADVHAPRIVAGSASLAGWRRLMARRKGPRSGPAPSPIPDGLDSLDSNLDDSYSAALPLRGADWVVAAGRYATHMGPIGFNHLGVGSVVLGTREFPEMGVTGVE
jgi:hypothetical protein